MSTILRKRTKRGALLLALSMLLSIPITSFASTGTGTNLVQTNTFQESTGYVANPFMGPVAFASNRSRNYEGTIVVGGYTWAEIEKTRGVYDFSTAESNNNYSYWVNEQNNQFMLGFAMDYPSLSNTIGYNQMSIPMWLYNELKAEATQTYTQLLQQAQAAGNQAKVNEYNTALDRIQNDQKVIDDFNKSSALTTNIPGVGTFYRWGMDLPGGGKEYRGGFSPNYSSPLLINYHDQVMKALANRYDNDKTYAMVMGSVGHWGEMHTYFIQGANDVGRYPGAAVAAQYEQAYAKYFKNTHVSVRYPRAVARDNNFGLHNHAFGSPKDTYDWYLNWINSGYTDYYTGDGHPAMPDFWKTSPSGAEFLYTGDYRYVENSNINATLQQAKDSHLTWLLELWYNLSPDASRNMDRLMATMGYRFAITEASFNTQVAAGNAIQLNTKWRNGGAAPFYHDWPIQVQLKNAAGQTVSTSTVTQSVRSLFPGTTETYTTAIATPETLAPGTYQLHVGIINPKTNQPAINLTVANVPNQNKLYHVGSLEVTAPGTVPPVVVEPPVVVVPPIEEPGSSPYAGHSIDIYGDQSMKIYDVNVNSQFNAVLRNGSGVDVTNQPLTWSVSGVSGVSITQNGLLTLHSTASEGTAVITVSMANDPAVKGVHYLPLTHYQNQAAPQPPVVEEPPVIVAPPVVEEPPVVNPYAGYNLNIYGDQSMQIYDVDVNTQFAAVLRDGAGNDVTSQPLTWSVSGVSGVSITQNGLLTVRSSASEGTVVITVTMKNDSSVKATHSVPLTRYNSQPVESAPARGNSGKARKK